VCGLLRERWQPMMVAAPNDIRSRSASGLLAD